MSSSCQMIHGHFPEYHHSTQVLSLLLVHVWYPMLDSYMGSAVSQVRAVELRETEALGRVTGDNGDSLDVAVSNAQNVLSKWKPTS